MIAANKPQHAVINTPLSKGTLGIGQTQYLLFKTNVATSNPLQLKRGMSKRGLRGASLAQLEKNLAEAFAILDTMGVSNNVGNVACFFAFWCNLCTSVFTLLADETRNVKEGAERSELGPTREEPCRGICHSGLDGGFK